MALLPSSTGALHNRGGAAAFSARKVFRPSTPRKGSPLRPGRGSDSGEIPAAETSAGPVENSGNGAAEGARGEKTGVTPAYLRGKRGEFSGACGDGAVAAAAESGIAEGNLGALVHNDTFYGDMSVRKYCPWPSLKVGHMTPSGIAGMSARPPPPSSSFDQIVFE